MKNGYAGILKNWAQPLFVDVHVGMLARIPHQIKFKDAEKNLDSLFLNCEQSESEIDGSRDRVVEPIERLGSYMMNANQM